MMERIYPWGDGRPYFSQACHMRQLFGGRVQKLSVDGGFTCPNRDGTVGTEGCTFCSNEAFTPSYCRRVGSISTQLEEGKAFHARRYRGACSYLAYFQSYSNTYAPLDVLRRRYEEALSVPGVVGIVVGTRPDCVDAPRLNYLAQLARHCYVAVEYGVESCYDATLKRVRRGHDYEQTCRAVRATAQRGLPCGSHLILGLPGESRDMMLAEADLLSQLPITSLKLHQLQLLKHTYMEHQYLQGNPDLQHGLSLPDYVGLVCDFLERLRADVAVERLAGEVPPRFQADPSRSWRRADGRLLRHEEIPSMVERELLRRGTWQGCRRADVQQASPVASPQSKIL